LSDAIALAAEETPESLRKIDELFDATDAKARKFPPKMISAMMLPGLKKVPARFAAFEARRRAVLVAIGIERFRLAHQGKIPDKLDDLVPAYLPTVPLDPFDGQALRYRRMEQSFLAYSIGSDGEDNDGKEHVRGNVKQTDITFIVER
jgi:hypothetical protein